MTLTLTKKQWVFSHLTLLAVLSLALFQFSQTTNNKLSISFLDVGQGDAILIQTPEQKNILIDTGPNSSVIGELSKKLNFFSHDIDLFILSHPDLDHYGGAIDILQKYPVKKVMLTGISSSSGLYLAFLDELKEKNIPIIYPGNNKDLQVGQDVYLDFLYPMEGQNLLGHETKNKNDTSISLIVRNKLNEPLVLLTGDAETNQERDLLLSGQSLQSPIFKLGHHGSKTSNTESFLAAVQPETIVASAGLDNQFGHPHQEVLDRVTELEVKSTAYQGTITFDIMQIN